MVRHPYRRSAELLLIQSRGLLFLTVSDLCLKNNEAIRTTLFSVSFYLTPYLIFKNRQPSTASEKFYSFPAFCVDEFITYYLLFVCSIHPYVAVGITLQQLEVFIIVTIRSTQALPSTRKLFINCLVVHSHVTSRF